MVGDSFGCVWRSTCWLTSYRLQSATPREPSEHHGNWNPLQQQYKCMMVYTPPSPSPPPSLSLVPPSSLPPSSLIHLLSLSPPLSLPASLPCSPSLPPPPSLNREWYHSSSVLTSPTHSQRLISALYDLSEVDFDLPSEGVDLDETWPSFVL